MPHLLQLTCDIVSIVECPPQHSQLLPPYETRFSFSEFPSCKAYCLISVNTPTALLTLFSAAALSEYQHLLCFGCKHYNLTVIESSNEILKYPNALPTASARTNRNRGFQSGRHLLLYRLPGYSHT